MLRSSRDIGSLRTQVSQYVRPWIDTLICGTVFMIRNFAKDYAEDTENVMFHVQKADLSFFQHYNLSIIESLYSRIRNATKIASGSCLYWV